jgi:hypothetical protein
MDEAKTREHLVEVDKNIADAQAHIVKQRERVAKLATYGDAADDAEKLLRNYEGLLATLMQLRKTIIRPFGGLWSSRVMVVNAGFLLPLL